MSDLADINVQVLQNRDLVVTRPETGEQATYRKDGSSLMQRFELDVSETLALKLTTSKLRQRLDWLDIEVVSLRDRAHLLQEEVTIKTAEQTNRNLQVLDIVTTIFLPATLVSGIFGMNVMGLPLPQNPHGFVWSMLILIGSSALVLWLLKRSGIFGR
jgi:zinc transporter